MHPIDLISSTEFHLCPSPTPSPSLPHSSISLSHSFESPTPLFLLLSSPPSSSFFLLSPSLLPPSFFPSLSPSLPLSLSHLYVFRCAYLLTDNSNEIVQKMVLGSPPHGHQVVFSGLPPPLLKSAQMSQICVSINVIYFEGKGTSIAIFCLLWTT